MHSSSNHVPFTFVYVVCACCTSVRDRNASTERAAVTWIQSQHAGNKTSAHLLHSKESSIRRGRRCFACKRRRSMPGQIYTMCGIVIEHQHMEYMSNLFSLHMNISSKSSVNSQLWVQTEILLWQITDSAKSCSYYHLHLCDNYCKERDRRAWCDGEVGPWPLTFQYILPLIIQPLLRSCKNSYRGSSVCSRANSAQAYHPTSETCSAHQPFHLHDAERKT